MKAIKQMKVPGPNRTLSFFHRFLLIILSIRSNVTWSFLLLRECILGLCCLEWHWMRELRLRRWCCWRFQVFWGVTLHCWESGSRHLLTLKLMVLRSSKPQALPCSMPAGHLRRLWVFIVIEHIQLTYSYLVVSHNPYSDSWSQAVNATKSEPFSFLLNCVLCMPSTVYNEERYYDLL